MLKKKVLKEKVSLVEPALKYGPIVDALRVQQVCKILSNFTSLLYNEFKLAVKKKKIKCKNIKTMNTKIILYKNNAMETKNSFVEYLAFFKKGGRGAFILE